MVNKMDLQNILSQAEGASENQISFARFVAATELSHAQDGFRFESPEKQNAYEACWFELEIVNGLALSEWESDGKPTNWGDAWTRQYKKDAEELIASLRAILVSEK
jgi:hypothetical protein